MGLFQKKCHWREELKKYEKSVVKSIKFAYPIIKNQQL